MLKQQQAPVQSPFFTAPGRINPVWQRWFQLLKTRDDEIKKPPDLTYTGSASLTTRDYGKIILFNIGDSDATCILPTYHANDLWAWLTIVRMGTGILTVSADATSRIEYSSLAGSIYCEETKRRAANITLQWVAANQMAIMAGLGTWSTD